VLIELCFNFRESALQSEGNVVSKRRLTISISVRACFQRIIESASS
jgi:hypothetical protein